MAETGTLRRCPVRDMAVVWQLPELIVVQPAQSIPRRRSPDRFGLKVRAAVATVPELRLSRRCVPSHCG